MLGIAKHRLKVTWSEEVDLHLNFAARGARWTAVVLRKDFQPGEWQDLIGGGPVSLTYSGVDDA